MLASSGATYPSETFIWKGGMTANPVQSDAGYIDEFTVHGFTTSTYFNHVSNWYVVGVTANGDAGGPNGNISVVPATRLPHGGDNVIFRRLENDPANGVSGGPWPKNPCLWGGFGFSSDVGKYTWAGSVGTTTDQQLPLARITVEESYGVSGGVLGQGWRLGFIRNVDGGTLSHPRRDGVTWDGLYLSANVMFNQQQKHGVYLRKFTGSQDVIYGNNKARLYDYAASKVWINGGTVDSIVAVCDNPNGQRMPIQRDKWYDMDQIETDAAAYFGEYLDSDKSTPRNVYLRSRSSTVVPTVVVGPVGTGFLGRANVNIDANVTLLNLINFIPYPPSAPDGGTTDNGVPVVRISRNPFTNQATRHTISELRMGYEGPRGAYGCNFEVGCGVTIDTLNAYAGQFSIVDELYGDETVDIIKGSVQGCQIDFFSSNSPESRLRIGTAGNTFDDGLDVEGTATFRFAPTTHVRAFKGSTGASNFFRNFEGDHIEHIKQVLNID